MGRNESDLVRRMIPVVAAWGVAKLLETGPLSGPARAADRHVHRQRQRAAESLVKAKDNALENGIWLAAGLVAVAAGIGMVLKATKGR